MEYSENLIESVWNKGISIEGYDSNLIRQDACGAWILKEAYSKANNDFAWGVEHIMPVSMGGDDNIDNLRPMNTRNIQSKANDYPEYYSALQAEGSNNVEVHSLHVVNDKLQEKLKDLYNK